MAQRVHLGGLRHEAIEELCNECRAAATHTHGARRLHRAQAAFHDGSRNGFRLANRARSHEEAEYGPTRWILRKADVFYRFLHLLSQDIKEILGQTVVARSRETDVDEMHANTLLLPKAVQQGTNVDALCRSLNRPSPRGNEWLVTGPAVASHR
ncbi:hypothetical protein AB0M87_32350 [Streptomyces sp. NPDC051320]|uniref:hypothetical protein n=1 Tax=Streptomyces sp. NPDC051320 TaxID=3154644 RepID=UPI003427493A